MTSRVGYLDWNNALAKRFFNESRAYEQVYLYVNDEVIHEVAESLGSSLEQFVETVRAGPPGATRSGHCQRALGIADNWRAHYDLPPYIAYLSLFVLAGGQEGEFAPHAYYPRLWTLLDEPGDGAPPSFDRMLELWLDLEQWANQDMQGSLGLFEARVVGEWIHVGLPLAQTVLTEAERRSLPDVFASARLEPGIVPTHQQLARALTQHGTAFLRPRTINALERGSESLREAILEVAVDDFESWDGQYLAAESASGLRQTRIGLRFCLAVDRVAKRVSSGLRVFSKREIPEDGVELRVGSATLVALECVPEWSHLLADSATSRLWEPPTQSWTAGLSARGVSSGWSATSRPTRVRAFVEGSTFGLPNLVEVFQLPRRKFYLAFPDSELPALTQWASADCDGWRDLNISSGLPSEWRLAFIEEATTDLGPRGIDPSLAFPERVSVRLLGGLRTAPSGNTFFAFAAPRLVVLGLGPDQTVWCEGASLLEDPANPGEFSLESLPSDRRLSIEVRNGTEVARRVSVRLATGSGWRLAEPTAYFDQFGEVVQGEANADTSFFGAKAPPSSVDHPADLLRTPGLPANAPKVYAIGNQRGQICLLPMDPTSEWDPVWLLAVDRRGRPAYCAPSLAKGHLAPGRARTPRDLDLWHRVLWQNRRNNTPPPADPYRGLWRTYQRSARAR